MPKPKPVPTLLSCSECGLAWERHEKATKAECIRLLKADLAARPLTSWTTTTNATGYTPAGVIRSVLESVDPQPIIPSFTLVSSDDDDPPDTAVPAAV
jgi:hypothetical protein